MQSTEGGDVGFECCLVGRGKRKRGEDVCGRHGIICRG